MSLPTPAGLSGNTSEHFRLKVFGWLIVKFLADIF